MRRLSTAFSVCLLASLATGCTREGPAYAPKPANVVAVVEMTNTFGFSPETVRILVGSTVEWRNTSIATHTVTQPTLPGSRIPSRLRCLPKQSPSAPARSGVARSGATPSPCPAPTATPACCIMTCSA